MKRKNLAILIVAILLISLSAGCQSSAPAATVTTAAASADTAATQATAGPPAKLTGITLLQSSDTKFPFPVEEKMAKDANVEITWRTVGITDWASQKPILLASGDMPDIWFAPSLNVSDTNSGVFLDLAPYIDKTTNIKKFFTEIPQAKAVCTNPEGTIYGLPSKQAIRPMAADTLYVNKVWCDKLGIALPKTTDEYEAMLKAFVTKDPNGNGKMDEVGYTGYSKLPFIVPGEKLSNIGTLQAFFPAFGVVVNQQMSEVGTLCMIKDGVVTFAPTMDGFKQCLIWLNKLYSEGLIDKELFNLDPPAMMAKLGAEAAPTAGAGSAWSKDAFCGKWASQFEYVPALKGPNGDQYWRSDYTFSLFTNTALIAKSCKEPDAAMRFLDLCYDQWNSFQICYGSDGVGTKRDANGNPVFISGPDGSTGDAFRFTVATEMGPGWAGPDFEKSVGGKDKTDMFKKFDVSKFYEPYFAPQFRYPTVRWDKATLDELSTLQTDVNGYVDQSIVNFVMKGNIEAGWKGYLDRLNKMGLPRLMEIYTKGYADSKK